MPARYSHFLRRTGTVRQISHISESPAWNIRRLERYCLCPYFPLRSRNCGGKEKQEDREADIHVLGGAELDFCCSN